MSKSSILLTGAFGFLGHHIHSLLREKFEIKTLGRGNGNYYPIDLSNNQPELREAFDWVIHNAGKAHITPRNQEEAEAFFQVNFEGTRNLLAALEKTEALPRQFIFISSIAVYGRESGENIPEQHPLEGHTPYAKSKIMAEQAVMKWCTLNNVRFLILRLPLVVGHNPPGNLGAIAKAIHKGYYFRIKGNTSRKSVILAEDVANFIPTLAGKEGIYNLTDGIHPTFGEIELSIASAFNKNIKLIIPYALAAGFGKIGDLLSYLHLPSPLTSEKLKKMMSTLTFDDTKAKNELGWRPRSVVHWLSSGGLVE